jgi:hypothetical protein
MMSKTTVALAMASAKFWKFGMNCAALHVAAYGYISPSSPTKITYDTRHKDLETVDRLAFMSDIRHSR